MRCRGCFNRGRNKRIKKILSRENLINLLNQGLNNTEIAKKYNISSVTVSKYIKNFDIDKGDIKMNKKLKELEKVKCNHCLSALRGELENTHRKKIKELKLELTHMTTIKDSQDILIKELCNRLKKVESELKELQAQKTAEENLNNAG